jgi:ABC-2 type transport system permease protein
VTAIVLYGLRESLRRKMFAVVVVLTLAFLALYAWGTHAAFRDTRSFVGPGQEQLDPDVLAGAIVEGLAMFATLFLGAVLSVFLTLNVVRGDAEAGLLQPLVVRPVGRAQLLLARFTGAAGVAALYVLLVYAATVAITEWAGGWSPDRVVAPGVELAGAVVVV